MKFSCVAIAAIVSSASAFKKPSTKITIHDGSFSDFEEAIEFMDVERTFPVLGLSVSADENDITFSGEANVSLEPALDPLDRVTSVKGIATWDSADNTQKWALTAESKKDDGYTTVDIAGDIPASKLNVGAEAVVSSGNFAPTSAGFKKRFDLNGGQTLDVTPTKYLGADAATPFDIEFNLKDESTDITATVDADMSKTITVAKSFGETSVEYNYDNNEHSVEIDYKDLDNTDIKLTATKDEQSIEITQRIDDDNTVTPSFTSKGDDVDISVAWEKKLGDGNSITATVGNSDVVNVQWLDDNWVVNGQMKVNGVVPEDIEIHMKRDIYF